MNKKSHDLQQPFSAYRIHREGGNIRATTEQITLDQLTAGEVVIEAYYSSVNYKDALAGSGKGKILRHYPLVGGIDVAGIVVSSQCDDVGVDEAVLITGSGLSEQFDGGYSRYVRAPARCVIPLPETLSLQQAMVMGTPALTAALALHRMEQNGQHPGLGPIAVTGASGGVGQLAIDLFSKQGYEVVAVTRKTDLSTQLLAIGATHVITPDELLTSGKALEKARWGGAVDTVGGKPLAELCRTTHEWGNIASIGLAAGAQLTTMVMPFILRGVSILGISSTNCPDKLRRALWQRLGSDLRPQHLTQIAAETITLNQLDTTFQKMLSGKTRGRILVDIRGKLASTQSSLTV